MTIPPGPQPPPVNINIRRALPADWPSLAEFYQRCFPERPRLNDARLWHWQFVEQPGADDLLPFFILDVDGRIEGAIGYLRMTLIVRGTKISTALPVNYFVNPKYLGLPALRLFRAVTHEAPVVIGAYISGDARRLLLKSGFIDLSTHIIQYYAALRPNVVSSIRGHAITHLRRAWECVLGFYARRCCDRITYIVSKEINPDWANRAAGWRRAECQVEKSAAYYHWRLTQNPVLDCTCVWQIQDTMPVGFAAVHLDHRERTAVLLEWNTDGVELHRDIDFLYAVIRFARSQHMDYLVTDAMSPTLHHALRWIGFGHRMSDLGFMVYGQDAEIKAVVSNPSGWHFMVGDSDRY